MSSIATLRKRLSETQIQIEMELAKYVKLHPEESLRAIGAKHGYAASWVCEIAKKYGVSRIKTAAAETI
jgi:hypothetical protein